MFKWAMRGLRALFSLGEPRPERDEEQALIRRAQQRGHAGSAAFSTLVERHQAWLIRYLHFMLGSRADAEDVAQDALLRAYGRLGDFRGDASFKGWLRVIATRLAFNHRRAAAARRRLAERSSESPDTPTSFAFERVVLSYNAVVKLLSRLPYPYREALILRHVECLSVAELAETLDLSPSGAKMRLSRARSALAAAAAEGAVA